MKKEERRKKKGERRKKKGERKKKKGERRKEKEERRKKKEVGNTTQPIPFRFKISSHARTVKPSNVPNG